MLRAVFWRMGWDAYAKGWYFKQLIFWTAGSIFLS